MNSSLSEEISLKDVWREVFKRKWLIIFISSISCIFSVIIAINLPNIYKSKVVLVPQSEEQGGLSSLAKNLGGLAGLAGVNLGKSSGPEKSVISLEILKSQDFIVRFVRNQNLTVPLMAAIASENITYELILDNELYNEDTKQWIREVKPPKSIEPSNEEIYEAFLDIFDAELDPKTGFIEASLEFYSPVVAKAWLELIVEEINNEIRISDKNEAEKSIEFLEIALSKTTNNNMKTTFYQLIEEQTKVLMLAESRDEYIFKTISPANEPEKKAKPSRVLIVIAGILIGGFLSLSFVLIRYFYKND